MRAWNRESCTPATLEVQLKYSAAVVYLYIFQRLMHYIYIHTLEAIYDTILLIITCISPNLALAGVVDEVLGDLPQRAALLPKVHNHTHTPCLGGLDGYLNPVCEVGS